MSGPVNAVGDWGQVIHLHMQPAIKVNSACYPRGNGKMSVSFPADYK